MHRNPVKARSGITSSFPSPCNPYIVLWTSYPDEFLEEEYLMSQEVDSKIGTACYVCKKDLGLEGKIIDYNEMKENWQILAIVCPNCSARYCPHHDKELKINMFRLRKAYDNAVCPNCGQSIKTGKFLVKPEAEKVNPEPKGVYLEAEKVPEVCPSCGGNKISTIGRPKRTIWNIIALILGIAGLFAARFANAAGSWSNIVSYVAVFMSIWLVWEGLTNKPLPIINRYLFNPGTTLHAKCNDCGHAWIAKN
jgi:hypothetical protein